MSGIPVSCDFNGDSIHDIMLYNPGVDSQGWPSMWRGDDMPPPSYGSDVMESWGGEHMIPVPGDHDGDGNDDLTVYDPHSGKWYSRDAQCDTCPPVLFGINWGAPGLQPVGALMDMPVQIVVYDTGGGLHPWNEVVPAEFRPYSTWFPPLHVILGPQQHYLMSSCRYTLGGRWYKYRWKMEAYLWDPVTGAILRQKELKGSWPAKCPPVIYGSGGSSSGDPVTPADFEAWLREFTDW